MPFLPKGRKYVFCKRRKKKRKVKTNNMNRDTIITNCRRLISFFKDNDKYADHTLVPKNDLSPEGLLKTFGRLLDLYGAPASYMSRLYLRGIEYDEFVKYAETLEDYKVVSWPDIVAISFKCHGYHWIVENK